MVEDLRSKYGFNNSIEKVFLVDESKRITSSSFNVFIPSLMNGIEGGLSPKKESINLENCLNDEKGWIDQEVSLSCCINAKSIHPYRFKHEGWIPEYKIQRMSSSDGTNSSIEASSTNGVTEIAADHTHAIKKAFKMLTNKIKSIIFNNIVMTNSTEVDYQELNRVTIKKGHAMYGTFVSGAENEFVIIAIDGVVPYYDNEDTDNNSNDQI